MPYVAVKGGEQAIQNAEALLQSQRRGNPAIPELTLDQIEQQLTLESAIQIQASSSHDYHEGVTAFVEKRKPQFLGN